MKAGAAHRNFAEPTHCRRRCRLPLPPPRAAESFAGCDAFDQRHKLALHRLAFHRSTSPQQPQAKCTVDEQQAIDLTRLAITVKEKRHRETWGWSVVVAGALIPIVSQVEIRAICPMGQCKEK